MSMSSTTNFKEALYLAWLSLSLISLIPIVIALISRPWLYSLSNAMTIPHEDCPFCGMTRAFDALTQGAILEAHHYNKGAIALAAIIIINAAVCLCVSIYKFRLKHKSHQKVL